jgi:hypothetical protein
MLAEAGRRMPGWRDIGKGERGQAGQAGPDGMGRRCVLLRGALVRTLAAEASLGAAKHVGLRSHGKVVIATGKNVSPIPGEPPRLGRGLEEAYGMLVTLGREPAFDAGVSLEVRGTRTPADAVARLCCFDPDGAVQLLQGPHTAGEAAPRGAKDGARRLELNDSAVSFVDGQAVGIELSEGSGAILQVSDTTRVELDGTTTVAKADPNNMLTVGDNTVKMTAGNGLNGAVEGNNFKLTMTGITVKTDSPANLSAQIHQLA